MNRGDLKADRVEKFKKLMEMGERYKRESVEISKRCFCVVPKDEG